ncbi:MAG: GAF domain-containing protein [Planctomycetia bacterium]|nr:GAF domain-containing protein [Planctomycetia bacterium]
MNIRNLFFLADTHHSQNDHPLFTSNFDITHIPIQDTSGNVPLPENMEDHDYCIISGKQLKLWAQLQQRNERAKQILNSISVAVLILDAQDEVIWNNKYAETLLRMPEKELLHQDFFNLFDNPEFEKPILVPTKEARETDQTVLCKFHDASDRFFEMEVSPWKPNLNPPKDFLLITILDVTPTHEQIKKLHLLHDHGNHLNELEPCDIQELTRQQQFELLTDGILQTAKQLLKYEMLELRELNPETNQLDLILQYGMTPEIQNRTVKISHHGYGIIGYVAATKKSYLCTDISHDIHYLPGGINSCSSLTVPILFQKTLLGVLNVESTRPGAFTTTDQMYMEIFARDIAVAMNTFHLLKEEQKHTQQTSVETIHRTIALPVNNILKASQLLYPFVQNIVNAELQLHTIMRNAKEVEGLIHHIGNQMSNGKVLPANLEAVSEDRNRVLYVDSSHEYNEEIRNILSLNGMEVYFTESGQKAITWLHNSFTNDEFFYTILLNIEGLSDYESVIDFTQEVEEIYADANMIPPFVFLQKSDSQATEQFISYANKNFSESQRVVLPSDADTLIEAVKRVSGVLFGQHVLLVDPKNRDVDTLREILHRRGCELDVVFSGRHALESIQHSLANRPYLLLLVAVTDITDYQQKTAFINDIRELYPDHRPPIVIVRELLDWDSPHVIKNTMESFKYSKTVGTPYTEKTFIETIFNVLRKMEENPDLHPDMVNPEDNFSGR